MISTARVGRRSGAAALVALAAFVTACSSSPGPPAASPTATLPIQSVPASTAATTPAPASSSPAPATSAPPGPGPCRTAHLQAKVGTSQGAAGSVYVALDFTNIGNVTCTLYGYPGVAFAGGSPATQIGLPAKENPTPPRQLVTLAPGKVAFALLRIVQADNYPASQCAPVHADYLQIYPPNQTKPIFLSYSGTACAKNIRLLTVNVVQPGAGG